MAFYAGAIRSAPLPETTEPAEFVRQLRAAGVQFVVAEQDRIPPALREGGEGMHPVHRVPFGNGTVIVFALEPPP
jgi:hypothetical protein